MKVIPFLFLLHERSSFLPDWRANILQILFSIYLVVYHHFDMILLNQNFHEDAPTVFFVGEHPREKKGWWMKEEDKLLLEHEEYETVSSMNVLFFLFLIQERYSLLES